MFADVGGVLVTHSGTVYTEAVTVSAGARGQQGGALQ